MAFWDFSGNNRVFTWPVSRGRTWIPNSVFSVPILKASADTLLSFFQPACVCFPSSSLESHPPHKQFRTQPKTWRPCSHILGSPLGLPFSGIFPTQFAAFAAPQTLPLPPQPSIPAAFYLRRAFHRLVTALLERVIEMWVLLHVLLIPLGSNPIQFLPAFGHSSVPSCLFI